MSATDYSPGPLLDPEDVARRLNVSLSAASRLMSGDSELVAYKIGGSVRTSELDLARFLHQTRHSRGPRSDAAV
jgi:hypothetical protein